METKKIVAVLKGCKLALELLHPRMDVAEPCVVYEAYQNVNELLMELGNASQHDVEADMCQCKWGLRCESCGKYIKKPITA